MMEAVAYFLRIEGVRGESMHAHHKDEIEVLSFSFAERQAVPSYGSHGASSSRIEMQDFKLVMKTSTASPVLLEACASGRHIKAAVLSVFAQDSDVLTFTLDDAIISAFE